VRIGLRGRLIAVLVFVSALTLAVAAVTLLSPLDQRLRDNALENLSQSLSAERGVLTTLSADTLVTGDRRLLAAARVLRRSHGAEIGVFSSAGRQLVSTDPDRAEGYPAADRARRSGRVVQLVTGEGQKAEAQVAIPISIDEHDVILAARKPIDDVQDTSNVVSRAFRLAAAAGLAGALLAGLLLAGRLSARIRRLRDTALRVAQIGPVAELKPDGGHDEIGDLSRAFATMQERLREQEHARRTFVSTASHELRTPLSSLRLMLDMLIDDLNSHPAALDSARAQAAKADQQAERLSQLAAELLDLSRLDAGVPLRTELVDLDAILRSVIAELDVRLVEQDRQIELVSSPVRWAIGDPGAVAQILRILLDNALRHTTNGVKTEIETDAGMIAVVVTDDGPGVAAEDADRIFQRFERGGSTREGGFGLGLAIGRELAHQMSGQLTLEPAAHGARFALRLPGAPAP
jgi:signal transduction histidine kinase